MVDIPGLIEKQYAKERQEYFTQLQLKIAANNRVMDEDIYKNLIRNLTKNLDSQNAKAEKLDRHALEALRLMTNAGANKTGGR